MSSATSILDDHSVHFTVPAKDPLGREAIAGKLRAAGDQVYFHWRFQDRTFRKGDGDMAEIAIPFTQVEKAVLKSRFFGLFRHRLLFQVSNPGLLASVPGTEVGVAELFLDKRGRQDAAKFIKFLDYKKSEAQADAARKRLNDLESQEI